jgi:plastocyanin
MRMKRARVALVLVIVIGVLSYAGLAGARSEATSVAVTAGKPSELRFTLSKRTVPKGLTTFSVVNRGSLIHNFKVAGKKTAILGPGKRATLKVTFTRAGKYPYMCTIAGHAQGGMKGVLTVR